MNMFKEKIKFLQKWIFLFLFCFGHLVAMSQDFLILKGGKNLSCKILREDSVKVFYETKLNGVKINASINRMEVEKIIFEILKSAPPIAPKKITECPRVIPSTPVVRPITPSFFKNKLKMFLKEMF